jgi:hypothetical protein
MAKAREEIVGILLGICGLATMGAVLSGFGLIAYQLFIYLYDGHWMSVSTVDGFLFILNGFPATTDSIFMSWLTKPDIWVGVHKILLWPQLHF